MNKSYKIFLIVLLILILISLVLILIKEATKKEQEPMALSPDALINEAPYSEKKMGVKIGMINLIMTLITLGFAFLLKISNMMISLRFVILDIILFMLYRGQNVISSAISFIEDAKTRNFEMILENEITLRASKNIGNVSEKVVKYDPKIGAYKVIESQPLMNTVKKYLQNLWTIQFEIIEILNVFLMLIVVIIINNIMEGE